VRKENTISRNKENSRTTGSYKQGKDRKGRKEQVEKGKEGEQLPIGGERTKADREYYLREGGEGKER